MNNQKTYRVFEFNSAIKDILEGSCSYPIWIQGEISDFDKNVNHQNIYFQLNEKDNNKDNILSSIKCVLYEFKKEIIRVHLREAGVKITHMDGLNVRLKVQLTVSQRYGNYLLIIQDIDPSFTLGQIARNREEIIDWLKKHNLLDKNKKQNLSLLPFRIGLIANEGEAYHDFINRLIKSRFGFKIYFYQSSVQGPDTEKEIIAGLNYFRNISNEIDTIVITRGGGSSADLSWFDSRMISENIANFPKPVLTGIGHFTNISIADLVAYQSLATPTAVSDYLAQRINDFISKLEYYRKEIYYQNNLIIKRINQTVENHKLLLRNQAQGICRQKRDDLKRIRSILPELSQKFLDDRKEHNSIVLNQLAILDPKNVMKRGFSITRLNKRIVINIDQLSKGDNITTILYRGKISSKINRIN